MLTPEENFKSYRRIVIESDNVVTFMEYYGIIDGFNFMWKRILKDMGIALSQPNPLEELMSTVKVSSKVYSRLIQSSLAVYE